MLRDTRSNNTRSNNRGMKRWITISGVWALAAIVTIVGFFGITRSFFLPGVHNLSLFFSGRPVLSAVTLLIGGGLIVCAVFATETIEEKSFSILWGLIEGPKKVRKRRRQLWVLVGGLILLLLVLLILALIGK